MTCARLCTFMWRRLFLQTIRRHYLALVTEMVFVLLTFKFFLRSDRVDLAHVRKLNSAYIEEVQRARVDPLEINLAHAYVVYGPKNDKTDRLIAKLRKDTHNNTIPDDDNYVGLPSYRDTAHEERSSEPSNLVSHDTDESDDSDDDDLNYMHPAATSSHHHGYGYQSWRRPSRVTALLEAEDVAAICSETTSMLMTTYNDYKNAIASVMCIQFASDSTHSISTGGLAYNVVVPVPPSFAFPTQVLPSKHDILTSLKAIYEDQIAPAVIGRMVESLLIVDHTHMLLQGNYKNSVMLYRALMPLPPPVYDIYSYRNGFFLATTIGFCLPLVWRIRDVTTEIGSGLKELQEVMGLSSSIFWIGHFLSAWFVSGIEGVFALLVATVATEVYRPQENYESTKGSEKERNKTRDEFEKTYNRVYKNIPESYRYLQNVDGSLVWASFGAFVTCHTLLALLIACTFPRGRWAMVMAFGLFFILPMVDAEKMNFIFGATLFQYFTEKRVEKLRTAFYPNVAFSRIIKIIGILDDFKETVDWGIITKPALNMDNVTIAEMFIILLTTTFIITILIVYLSNVLPWTTSRPQPLLFPITPSYWFPPAFATTATGMKKNENAARFEHLPQLDVVIECKNLVKVFGGTVALNKVNITTYKSQVTILLGHNGAGKTTLMSILTGLIEPNSGLVLVSGKDIRTAGFERMGFCPQFDALFADLTVSEHLSYFGGAVRLSDKADAFPEELSGGMKRKLSIALALLTSPEVLILDEPTAALDPETRRSIWSLIKELRGDASILLSTHDMEEADVLGDRIIVMYNGSVISWGSPSFLKNACGVGYKLRIQKEQKVFKSDAILALVKKTVPQAIIEDEKENEAIIALHTMDIRGFPVMFRELEGRSKGLGIKSTGVSVATMQDAYVKIYTEWVGGRKDVHIPNAGHAATSIVTVQLVPGILQRFRALMQKRLLYLWRTPFLFITGWILPVVIAYIGLGIFEQRQSQVATEQSYINMSTTFAETATDLLPRTFIGEETAKDNNSLSYKVLLESEDIPLDIIPDVFKTLLEKYNENYFEYISTYAFGTVFNKTIIEMWINLFSMLGSSIQQNLIDTVLLREQTGQPNARFDTGISVVPLTPAQAHVDETYEGGPLNEVINSILLSWIYWGLLVPMSTGLLASSFVVLPSMEICNEARELQLMTGLTGCTYLGTHFLFDLLFYFVPMTTLYLGFSMINNLSDSTQATLRLVMALSAPVNILLPYLISEYSADSGTAYAVVMALYAIGGPGVVMAYILAATLQEEGVRWPFLFFPPFQLPAATVRAINFEPEIAACHYVMRHNDSKYNHNYFCWAGRKLSATIKICCDVINNKTSKPWHDPEIMSASGEGIFYDLLFMISYGVLIFLYLLYRTSKSRASGNALPLGTEVIPEDEDVAAEWKAVERMCLYSNKEFAEHALIARRLHKRYDTLQAVKELSLALRPAECFGLLGVNGAGKTTTFRMLTALTPMTYGEAFMRDVALSEEPRKWQSRIGYCPQGDALLGKLNAYENLYLFGRLRGVPEENLPDVVAQIIDVTGLEEHATKRCDYYSGGNKRKLSIAIALVGLPGVVFLDEPYAGVDVLARTRIYKRLTEIKEHTKCSMVLTSHSMEECEVACDRICIMVQGAMVCLGTLQHLKDKFGKGCSIKFLLRDNANIPLQEILKAVGKVFPGMTVLNLAEGKIEIRTRERLPWSVLFNNIESLDKDFAFEGVLASDTTLEQLFIEFAEKGQNEKELHSTRSSATLALSATASVAPA